MDLMGKGERQAKAPSQRRAAFGLRQVKVREGEISPDSRSQVDWL
jgi:hypothetical protein